MKMMLVLVLMSLAVAAVHGLKCYVNVLQEDYKYAEQQLDCVDWVESASGMNMSQYGVSAGDMDDVYDACLTMQYTGHGYSYVQKTCYVKSVCDTLTLNEYFAQLQATVSCCYTDLCNDQVVPACQGGYNQIGCEPDHSHAHKASLALTVAIIAILKMVE